MTMTSSTAPMPANSTKQNKASQSARNRFILVTCTLVILTVILLFLSIQFGAASATFDDVLHVLTGKTADNPAQQVLVNLRIPRALLGAVVGLHFAVAGLILQSILRNPLAEPGVLGVSAGASLAVVFSILLANEMWGDDLSYALVQFPATSVPFIALIGGIAASILVLWISWDKRLIGGLSPRRLALGGVVCGTFLNALVLMVIVSFGAGRAEMAILWLAGTLFGRGFDVLMPVLPWTVAGLVALPLLAKPLSLLRFGEEFARSAGLNVGLWRTIAAMVAIGMTASAVSAAGPIAFIGLVTPHMARLLVGGSMGQMVVTSALCGMALTIGTDFIGRMILTPLEIPLGIITSLIGVPIFLLLLQRNLWKLS